MGGKQCLLNKKITYKKILNEELREELKNLIHSYGLEKASDTKDIILADYLLECLAAFNNAVSTRKMLPKDIDCSWEE